MPVIGGRISAVTASGVLTRIEACIPALRRYAAALLRNREDADDLCMTVWSARWTSCTRDATTPM